MRVLPRVGVIIATPLFVFTLSFIVHAQDTDAKGNTGGRTSGGKSGFGSVSGPTTSGPKVIRVPGKTVLVKPTTGTLFISAEPGATIRLVRLKQNGEVADESENPITTGRSIIFNDLPPGTYRVVAEKNGYMTTAPREVEVPKGKSAKVDITLMPKTYNVTVRLNASSGTVFYATGNEASPRSVPFQNNTAYLSSLIGDNYNIRIVADDASYKPLTETLRVPSAGNEVSYTLEKLSESGDFSPATASDWALPSGWYFSSRKVVVNGSGTALLSDSNYRNYKDFQLSTDVRMMNGVAASFVVHAVDAQNYYLVQITGPNADEQYVLRGYIVRNGSLQRFGRTTPISQFSDTLKPGKYFHVVLTVIGSEIIVQAVDSDTGDLKKLGTLPEPSHAFPIGAVGIAARDNEQNEVGQFSICSAKSMSAGKCEKVAR
jgi:hypothetical protein